MTPAKKPLKCGRCGHRIGQVSVKPKFNRKLLWYSIIIVFSMELVSNFLTSYILKFLEK